MRIGIIGTGTVGTALGTRFAEKGHEVVYGSRTPGDGSVTQQDAARDADLIITAIPGNVVIETLESIGEDTLGNKIVLDMSVAMTDGMKLLYPGESVGSKIQGRFPALRVVKSLNTMNVAVMIDPAKNVKDPMVFVSGDDDAAKDTVAGLLGDLGWAHEAIFDLGGIDTAAGTENALWLFFATFQKLGTPNFMIAIAK